MSWAKRFRWACTAVVAGLVLPNAASAHVGTEAPVATNFEALIRRVTPPSGAIEARVIDGDRELWLHQGTPRFSYRVWRASRFSASTPGACS